MRSHLCKRFPTLFARVWTFTCVSPARFKFQFRILTETQIWDRSIRPDMGGEGTFVMKFAVAMLTLKWIVTGVFTRMIIVRFCIDEGCITIFTLVRPFTCMLSVNKKKRLWIWEREVRKICNQNNLPNVRFVWLQLGEWFPALFTLIWFFAGVRSVVFGE